MAKHYAIADIHGMYDIYKQVKERLNPYDIVYFLGDAGDRGYDSWKCIKAIYNDPQWVYLKGNHEDLMVRGLKEAYTDDFYDNDSHFLWMYNGGNPTENEWLDDGMNTSWIYKLGSLPYTAEYINSSGYIFHMSHAGYTCGKEPLDKSQYLWDRDHFCDKWDKEKYSKDICLHGHTPNEILISDYLYLKREYKYDKPEAFTYCDGHKICIDNGVFYTGATVLYDLDEMKAIPLFDLTKIYI